MMRYCPNCETERPVNELFCEGEFGEAICSWPLSSLPIRPNGWRSETPSTTANPALGPVCVNGHSVESGDLMCPVCGADVATGSTAETPLIRPHPYRSAEGGDSAESQGANRTEIAGWRLLRRLPAASQVRERYETIRTQDGREAVLTLYTNGSEPDPEVYEVLRTLDRDHVPEILETGRWQERAYEVSEDLRGGTLAELGPLSGDVATLSYVLEEIGKALAAFGECGLRHRDLRPGAIMVRLREPLDLVVTGFGSARLSDYDLDVVSPLEITRYMAPEAVAGGVAAASDWWSLGMLLLEQVTNGDCFAGADDQAFLIHILTNGAPVPKGLPTEVDSLLRGLLSLDRHTRWGWAEVQRWLAGDIPALPPSARTTGPTEEKRALVLGGTRYTSLERFALGAAGADLWQEARDQLLHGELSTWLEETGESSALRAEMRAILGLLDIPEDFRLAAALKALNPSMPLVVRGEIVTPGWLTNHPEEGYSLVTGPLPDRLESKDHEVWLARLKRREVRVRERARQLDVELDEGEFRLAILSTSKSRLAAIWDEKRRILPDTDHPGLLALVERRVTEEEDFILLLSAAAGQFRSADTIVDEAERSAQRAGLETFDRDEARRRLLEPRRQLNADIEKRLEGFARCGRDRIDAWGDQFRLERRLPLSRSLALLAVPQDQWRQPPKQSYVATLLDFFARRITGSIMRGPLTRMVIGKTTARLDLTELDSPRQRATVLLDHVLLRNDQTIDIDPSALTDDPRIERRLRTLHSHATLYRRDTGIDGLYLGFPFLVMQEAKASTRPRIAPILLWPVKLHPEVGSRGRVTLAFDRDREEVRLNPAFETLLGVDAAARWQAAANDVLGRSSVTTTEVVEAFGHLAQAEATALMSLPSRELKVKAGDDRISCAAAIFHLGFLGQAVMEDLRHLKARPPIGSSLETAFRVSEDIEQPEVPAVAELEKYFTSDSDPSQEAAVLKARSGTGLLVEGPPGTGKSQTIVNMVADAIGTGRSLLVVCQKQAALEVVHKRLEAAGLGNRIVMVNDVNKDRELVIRTIREQLEALFQHPPQTTGLRLQRQQAALRIEGLERDLNGQHLALHAVDEQTGLSYRSILGDLIHLNNEGAVLTLPALRHVLDGIDPGRLAVLQEACAPIARLWLPAHYEGSPLAQTRDFGMDEGSRVTFQEDLQAFARIEAERLAVIERTPNALAIDDPASYQTWSSTHGQSLRNLDETTRHRLARWLDRLSGASERASGVTPAQIELAAVEQAMLGLPADDAPTDAVDVARAFPDDELSHWRALSDRLHGRPSLVETVNPARWFARLERNRIMKQRGLSDSDAFRAALHRETRLRPLRMRLISVNSQLGEETENLASRRIPELIASARSGLTMLARSEEVVRSLEAYPDRATTYAMARASSRQAVDDLITGIDQATARHAARVASRRALEKLRPWLGDDWLAASLAAITADSPNMARIAALFEEFPRLMAYQRFRARVPQLAQETMNTFAQLSRIRSELEGVAPTELEATVRRILATEARLAWKARLERTHPALLFEAGELHAKSDALIAADRDMRMFNRRHLVDGIDVHALSKLKDWEDITRLRGARARRLREFVERGADLGLMQLRPVWLVNPDVASRLLPLTKALFDTVIYDEASQMPIEYALPTLYRSSAMIVSGDEKQMPPTTFFSSRVENDEAEIFEGQDTEDDLEADERSALEETWNRREIKDCPDLLQLAKTVLPSTTLQIHYRSAFRELIQFSNASFYINRLSVPARHPADEVRRKRPIELIRVDGLYVDQTNPAEAERVADVLRDLWLRAEGRPPTIGVVTFNRKQADLIESVLESRAEYDPGFRMALMRERDRVVSGEDMGFFVKNVENVQGDERDVIIFSSTFGRNSQGTFRRSFGVLGQVGGERRLNVAVTRARQKVILVTSMPIPLISDFLTTRRQASSPRDFLQAYFEYARALSDGDLAVAEGLLLRLTPEQRRTFAYTDKEEDGLETAVAAEIRSLGWEPAAVRDDGAFDLDFAIEDPRTGLYGIGIECDAPRHPLLKAARAREMWRPAILRRSIPVIHRVSSHRWFHEPDIERARLRAAITSAMGGTA